MPRLLERSNQDDMQMGSGNNAQNSQDDLDGQKTNLIKVIQLAML